MFIFGIIFANSINAKNTYNYGKNAKNRKQII